uniref:Aminotran_1_2 domain-containing protein n=1 Tax=Gongylonema pulchrum TaxID=637853 RepID=A0A183D836_9BILA
LESLLNFQTMVRDLTGLEIANASLLDESTACAEAMTLAVRFTKRAKLLVDPLLHPQNIAVIETRARPLNIELENLKVTNPSFDSNVAGVILQYPNTEGNVLFLDDLVKSAHDNNVSFLPFFFSNF